MTEEKELWGGAITTKIPSGLIDASDYRQVPDTQEVFLPGMDATETSLDALRTQDSLILELMERIDGDDIKAIKEHFTEISTLNSANEWLPYQTKECTNLLGVKSYVSIALEPALKWGSKESDDQEYKPALAVLLGVVRLQNVETDLLITYNAHFSDKKELRALEQLQNEEDQENVALKRINYASGVVEQVIQNLKVEDWGLFG